MRLPRFRVRTLMIAVAVVGSVLAVGEGRRSRFQKLAFEHQSQVVGVTCAEYLKVNEYYQEWKDGRGRLLAPHEVEKDRWHRTLARKYRSASPYPWLPVAFDPPEPR